MTNKRDRLDDYPLFYEEIGQRLREERMAEQIKEDATYSGRASGLSEDQLAKLADDLRSPIQNDPGDSFPLQ